MNDLDLIKRIAQIEGIYDELLGKQASHNNTLVHVQEKATIARWYNPLTDDALLKRLIFKHEVSIDFTSCQAYILYNGLHVTHFHDLEYLPRAILELIIEAKAND